MWLLLALGGVASAADAACDVVSSVPATVQVAWVSPLDRQVRGGASLEVVRVSDLRALARANDKDATRILQGLGLAPRNGGRPADQDWKVTLFDVKAEWLCRPIEDATAGEDKGGVAVCGEDEDGPIRAHRRGYTGCGYTLDTGPSKRGLDVYRVDWESASTWGFCVMPLDRFLNGA